MKKEQEANVKDTFLTVKDVCKKLNVSQSVIYTVVNFDRLETERLGGRIVIREEVFKKWAEKNAKPQAGESK
jgi:excisionase family DNA binding protein